MFTLKNQPYYYDMDDDVVPVIDTVNTSDPDWILYNGYWDDNGSWYDTSYWIDGISGLLVSTDVAFSGTKSLKVEDNSGDIIGRTPFFNIKSTRTNPVKISTWVYTTSDASTTNLCGVGIFNDGNETPATYSDGYYAVVDTRNGTGSTAAFQIRKTADSGTILDSDDSLSVVSDAWYRVEMYVDGDNQIVAKLYDTDMELLSTLTSTDTDYTEGYFALTTYEEAYFDDIHILGDKEVDITSAEWMAGYEEYYYELVLVNPVDRSQVIAYITDYSDLNIRRTFNEVNEVSFTMPYYVDEDMTVNPAWDLVYEDVELILKIKIDDMELDEENYLVDLSELVAGDKECKRVHAYSKEYKLGKKKVIDFAGTTQLYDSVDDWNPADSTQSGILNYIIEYKLQDTWSVSYMSSSLVGVQRTFDITNKSVLEVIRDIQEQFDCVILFDSAEYTMSIYAYDEIGTNKGLIIAIDNYMKNMNKKIKLDEVVTRLYVQGDEDVTISGVNITGQSYIDDFSFFKSLSYMSQSLIDALDAFETKKSGYEGTFAGYLSDLSTAQSELTVLEGELSTLNNELIIIENHLDECIKFGTSGGQNYTYWRGQESSKNSEITSKEGEITSKESEIDGIEADIAAIVLDLAYSTNFTTAQLQELNKFIYEDVVKCNTTDTTILMAYGEAILESKSEPPIEFSIDLVDIFNSRSEQFQWEKLSLGDLVTVTHENFGIDTEVRVMALDYGVDGNNLSIDFSNNKYWNNDINYLNDIIRKSKQVADTNEKERFEYKDYYENDKDTITDFITSPIDTTDNEVLVGGGATLNRRGLLMRDVSSSLGQMKILGNRIVFTQDNWDSYSLAITPDGVQTTGEFKLYSENSYGGQNIVQIDGNGILIYGSETAGEGLIIYNKDDEEVFSLDTSGNIIMTGNITMNGGSIDWNTVDSDPAVQTAQDAADAAQGDADTANALLDDIASDGKLTPVEKKTLKREWDAILSEKVLNVAQATEFGVSSTDYETAYNALYQYVVTDNNLLGSLATTSTIVGSTFRDKFKDYYDERVDLLNAIADKNKSTTESIAEGTYSGGTFIDGFLVQSGTILTNSCGMTNDDASDEPEYTGGVSNPSYSNAGSDIRIWAGDSYDNRASAPFRVSQDGSFFAGNGTDNYIQWDGSDLTVRGGLNASDITAGTISTASWTGSGTNYISMSRQLMYYKEGALTKMAMGFLADKDGVETPLIVMGAGDGNGNNRGYIEKSTDGLSMYYIGDLSLGEVSYIKLEKDKATINGYEIFSEASTITDSYIDSASTWNDKISEAEAKVILEDPSKAWDIPQANFASTVSGKIDNGDSAWSKFSGSGDTLPSGNVEFNFAGSSSKGGSATNTVAVGTQSATNVQNATVNFNARNDRKSTTPADPTIDTDGTAIDHTLNTDGSSDISFEWNFSGSGDAYDIDGFIIYVYQNSSSSSYNFGTTVASEQVFYVTPEKRAFILYGVPANKYYTFGVQAYRIVDTDVDSDNVLKSSIIQPSLGSENPYRPSSSVAFSGNITGTIDGESAEDVKDKVQSMNTSGVYLGTVNASQINVGTLTGFTIQTASSGARIVMSSGNVFNCYNSSGNKHGLQIEPSAFADVIAFNNGSINYFVKDNGTILDMYAITGTSSRASVSTSRRYMATSGANTYLYNTWDFSSATITGLTAVFG
jgi:hypothetical protein